jgi:cytochrome c-type biogenesis protein CcmH
MSSVNWIPSLIALAIGLVVGVIAVWRMARSGTALPSAGTVEARDLDARTEGLLRQLRELDDTAAKRSPEQLARERYALELEAARTLRDLEGVRPASAAAVQPRAPAPASRNGAAWRGFLWGTGTMTAAGLLLFLLSGSAHERREGGQLTGNLPGEDAGRAAASPADDAELATLTAAVAKSPDDIEARVALIRGHLVRRDMMAVWSESKVVLQRSPGEPRALSYQALVRLEMGQGDLAAQMIEKALADRPDFTEGYLHLATIYMRTGRAKEAEATIERAAKRFPAEEGQVREIWGEIRRAGSKRVAPDVRDPHDGVAAPAGVGGAAQGPVRDGAEGVGVSGTIALDPAIGSVESGGILFVMVRPESFGAGPPLAAKRIVVTSFPVTFEIGPGDAMTGEPFPETLLLQARLDLDGNPTTRDKSEPVARLDHVKKGSRGISLTLARPAP